MKSIQVAQALLFGLALCAGSSRADEGTNGGGSRQPVVYAGTVKTLVGSATRQGHDDAAPIALHVGDRLQEGDRIATLPGSTAGITLSDDTLVSMGPSSQFVIERFRFDPQTHQGDMVGSVLRGTMAFVTGIIAKANPLMMKIKTPSATVGIRGTEFIVDVPEDEAAP